MSKRMLFGGLAALGLLSGVAALYFYPFITPEMIEHAQLEQEQKIAALTEDEKAWLRAEADHKAWVTAEHTRATEKQHADMAALLEEDIKAYGTPAR